MMCNSFGLKISAISKASFSERAATFSTSCGGGASAEASVAVVAAANAFSPLLLPLPLPLGRLREMTDCSRQPITSPKASQETESKTCATTARSSCSPVKNNSAGVTVNISRRFKGRTCRKHHTWGTV